MTDTAKATVWDAVFLPWGGVHAITGSATLDARFPGQRFQLESGLHYNWHRQYDPTIGRYIQADPLGFVDGPSVYAYAQNMPQAVVDLLGLAGSEPWVWPPTGPPTQPSSGTPGTVQPSNPFPFNKEPPDKKKMCENLFNKCIARCTTWCGRVPTKQGKLGTFIICGLGCNAAYAVCVAGKGKYD